MSAEFFPQLSSSSSSSSSSSCSESSSESDYLWVDDLPALETPPSSPACPHKGQPATTTNPNMMQPTIKQPTVDTQGHVPPATVSSNRLPLKKRLAVISPPQPPKRFKPPFEATPRTTGPGTRTRTTPRRPPTPAQKPPVAEAQQNRQASSSSTTVSSRTANPPRNFIVHSDLWQEIQNLNIPWLRIMAAKRSFRMQLDSGDILRFTKINGGLIKIRLQHRTPQPK